MIDPSKRAGPFMEGKPDKFRLSEEMQLAVAQRFFRGKTEVPDGLPLAVTVLHGPPGVGKTEPGFQKISQSPDFGSTILVCYDEHGALYEIPAYLVALSQARDVHDRINAWATYRDDSQRIRSQVNYGALNSRYHMYIDSTSSSPGTLKMIEALRKTKDIIRIEGTYAPLHICEARVFGERDRPTSWEEFITKRLGAHDMFPKLVEAGDSYVLNYNPTNFAPALEVMRFEKGQIVSGSLNFTAYVDMLDDLDREAEEIKSYLEWHLSAGDLTQEQVQKMGDIAGVVKNYRKAVADFGQAELGRKPPGYHPLVPGF